MKNFEHGKSYIYEKADGVTYGREFGSTERFVVGYDHDILEHKKELEEAQLWVEIRKAAKNNKAIQRALDRVKILYRLSKDDPL